MKTSPFYTGKIITGKTSSGQIVRWDNPDAVKIETIFAHNIKAKMDDDRIYVWPIFYKNFLMYSFLWPFAEINDVGWEIRPLISADNYNKEYRILTGGWNSKNGAHYTIPFYAKDKTSFSSLPFSYQEKSNEIIYNYMLFAGYFTKDKSSFFAPIYYYDGTEKRIYTPICSFGKDSGYILPFYFYDINDANNHTKNHYILPPFGKMVYRMENGEAYCNKARFFPLFFYDNNYIKDRYENPKYKEKRFSWKNRPDDYWLYNETKEKSLFVIPGNYFSENRDKQQKTSVIFPFYFSGYNKYKDNDKEWLTLFPFYIYSRDKKTRTRSFMLLAGDQEKEIWGKQYSSSYIIPFYYYNYSEIGEHSIKKESFFFPSIFQTEYDNKKYSSFTMFPFYFNGYDKRYDYDSEWFNIFPAYSYSREKSNIYKSYGVIAGTRDEKIMDKQYHSSYLFPFYNYSYKKIYHHTENPKYKGKHFSWKTRPKDFYIEDITVARKSYIFPTIYSTEYENGKYSDKSLFPFYNKGFDHQKGSDKEWFRVFPFYSHKRDKEDVSKNYMVLAGTTEQTIAGKQYSSSYFLPFYYNGYSVNTDYKPNPKYNGQKMEYSDRPDDYYLKIETAEKKTYIFPNIFTSENRDKKESSFTFFPFLFHDKTEEYEESGSPFSIYQRHKSFTNDNLHMQLLWYMYYYDRDQSEIVNYIFPSYYSSTSRKKNHTVTNFFPFTFHEKSDYLDTFGTFLWLYTSKNDLKKKSMEKQLFWYLYYNKQYAGDKKRGIEPYESSRILWKVYHRETKGDVTNVDLFPFISYSKNRERSKFSFAYHFFSIEKDKKSTKIHLLFLPIWW
jgi:hypothetical protein